MIIRYSYGELPKFVLRCSYEVALGKGVTTTLGNEYISLVENDAEILKLTPFITSVKSQLYRVISIFKDIPLRTRRALSLYKIFLVIIPFRFSTEHL